MDDQHVFQSGGKTAGGRWLFVARLSCAVALLALVGLALASSSSATSLEQVGIFSGTLELLPKDPKEVPEDFQMGGVSGLAVNIKGASGAPGEFEGNVYAATKGFSGEGLRIARFKPSAGGLKFSEAWEVLAVEGPYERCGPEGDPKHPHCTPRAEGAPAEVDVDVDQTTGDVYAFRSEGLPVGGRAVTIYSPDGSEVIGRFGERAPDGKTTAETPEQIHESDVPGGIAVDGAGNVYIFDLNLADNSYHRLMIFSPKVPGDYKEYEYKGEIAGGFLGEGKYPSAPVTDTAGHIYVAGNDHIEEYDPATPSAPICSFQLKTGGITAMTVNPDTEEPIYYSNKDKKLHLLSACEEGKFTEVGAVARTMAPKRGDIYALAFDPEREFGVEDAKGTLPGSPCVPGELHCVVTRPPGALYGGVPEVQGEFGRGSIGYIFAPAEENPPVIEAESVAGATATSAELRAEINPRNFATHYVFQYLTDAAYKEAGETFAAAAEVPGGGAGIGGGQEAISVADTVSGLSPETDYRYRVIATSHCAPSEIEKECVSTGATRSFHTFALGAGEHPDARAYEMVSPAEKGVGQVLPADPTISSCPIAECKPGAALRHFPMQSAPDGEAIVFEGTPFVPSQGAVLENEYLAKRTEAGWTSTNLTPPLLKSKGGGGYKAFDPALQEGLLEQTSPSFGPPAPSEYTNIYRQPTNDPLTLEPLLTEAPPHRLEGNVLGGLRLTYAGASDDLSRIFFEANDELAGEGGGGEAEETNLYEWSAGQLHLISVLPGGAEASPGASFGSGLLLNSGSPNVVDDFSHAISTDGSRAFWSSKTGQAYVRLGGTTTVEIPDHSAKFLSASADGSKVLLTDGHLYGELEAEPPVQEADLTQGMGGFEGIVGQSEDLSRIYFVLGPAKGKGNLTKGSTTLTGVSASTGAFSVGQTIEGAGIPAGTTIASVGAGTLGLSAAATATAENVPLTAQALLAGENSEGAKAQVGGFNLYGWDEGTSTFVATLLASDNENRGDWQASPVMRTAEASPDGRWVSFLSDAPLTGYDNTGPCKIVSGTTEFLAGPCREVFLYDSATGALSCPSCSPSGASPLGPSTLRLNINVQGSLPQPRYLTDSGRLYFDSQDSLVPSDTNGRVEDVYQFEPEGIGSCEREGGCVALISAGRGAVDSNFLAMDETGANIFFTSRDRLVSADQDNLIDLYDARVGGGPPPVPGPPRDKCEVEGCPPSQPELPLASESLDGPGNVKKLPPKRCKKGQVKRGGRCVRKPRHRRAKAGAK